MYRLMEVCWVVFPRDLQVAFWPVLARPGRQRRTRLAFDHPAAAAVYGLAVARRYGLIFGGKNG